MPQLDSCVPACNHELETLALLSYFLGVYWNLLEHANFPILSHWCQQRKHRRVCALAKTRLSLRCFKLRKYQLSRFFLIDASSESSGESVHLSLRCFKMRQIPNVPIFSLSFNASSENSGGAVHWHKLDWAFFSWKCDNLALWDISDKTLEYQ